MNRIDEIFNLNKNPENFSKEYAFYLSDLLKKIDFGETAKFIEALLKARETGSKIFFIGNGGSAATASHFANDFSIGPRLNHKPFKAISLTDNLAIITAIANDDGYEHVFTKQLQNLAEPGDILVAISASGNSPNIINAIEFAKSKSMLIVGLSGFDGGQLKKLSDIKIHVETKKGEYGPVEDVHMFIDHLVGSYLNRITKV